MLFGGVEELASVCSEDLSAIKLNPPRMFCFRKLKMSGSVTASSSTLVILSMHENEETRQTNEVTRVKFELLEHKVSKFEKNVS